MKAKKYLPLAILAAVVVILGVALIILSNLDEEEETGVPLFDFDTSTVTALAYRNDETDATLLQDEDEAWYLEQDPTLPLDQDSVSSLLEKYTGLQALRDLGAGTENEDMGLDNPTLVFTLGTDGADIASAENASSETATAETASGVYTVTIGAENSITEAYYAKVSWNDHIYTIDATDLSGLVKTSKDLYAEQDVVDLETDDVATMTVESSGEILTFAQNDGTWTLQDDPDYAVDQDIVKKMASTICDMTTEMSITQPEDNSTYGLDEPQAVVTLVGTDGTTITCSFGDLCADDSDLCYMRSSHAGGVVYEVDADHRSAFAYTKDTLKAATEETADSDSDSSDIIAENPVGGEDDYANSAS